MASVKRSNLKDPSGGLTAAGRRHFKETRRASLRPGVKDVKSPEDVKRKGSFLRRHYAKKTLSPLVDAKGEPTRYAKQAHAWGEPVPKTRADVARLAKKGRDLLDRYHETQGAAVAGAKPRATQRKSDPKPAK